MPRTKSSLEQLNEMRRQQILSHSLRLFALNGYDATSIKDIASAIGKVHGLIYHYFKDKEEIFTTLLDQALELQYMPIFPHPDTVDYDDPTTALRSIITHIYDELNTPNSDFAYYFYLFLNMRFQKTAPQPRFRVPQKELRPFHIITGLIKAGQEKGVFEYGDPRDMAVIFFATLRGITYVRLHESSDYNMPSIDVFMNLFMRKATANA